MIKEDLAGLLAILGLPMSKLMYYNLCYSNMDKVPRDVGTLHHDNCSAELLRLFVPFLPVGELQH